MIGLDEDDQEALIDLLGDLVRSEGSADLLHRPMLLPTPEFFPDAWRPDLEGARLMLRRLLAWVRLGDRKFTLDIAPADPEDVRPTIAFLGEHEGVLRFEVEVMELPAAEVFAGAMVREVARAWLFVKRLEPDDEELDEVFVDIAAVFLGAGVLAANTSCMYRTEGRVHVARWSVTQLGALGPAEHAFLLGVVLRVRSNSGEVERVSSLLEPAQRELLAEALAELPLGETLRRWLDIVAFGEPAAAPAQPEAITSLPKPDVATEVTSYAFRHLQQRWLLSSLLGVVAASLLSVALKTPWILVPGLLAGFLGRWWTYDVCSECNCLVRPEEERCVGCGALLVGRFSKGSRDIEPRFLARVEELKRVVAQREQREDSHAAELEREALDARE